VIFFFDLNYNLSQVVCGNMNRQPDDKTTELSDFFKREGVPVFRKKCSSCYRNKESFIFIPVGYPTSYYFRCLQCAEYLSKCIGEGLEQSVVIIGESEQQLWKQHEADTIINVIKPAKKS